MDNSGSGKAREYTGGDIRLIENAVNVGFGVAVNQAIKQSTAPFIATLNDDAVADPRWLEALLTAVDERADVGMCASSVRLSPESIDSAGMRICLDGSSKQRGHLEPPAKYSRKQECLLPSGSAALYRRKMLDEIGLFDDAFFLYCEDTDLGLRGRWMAWECLYVPDAIVEHRYSHSAGRASALKAYYVERNRLFLAVKNFPALVLAAAPFYTIARYFWHSVLLLQNRGKAAHFVTDGQSALTLPLLVLKAHWATFQQLPRLLRQRKEILRTRRLSSRQFSRLLTRHSISPREVAVL